MLCHGVDAIGIIYGGGGGWVLGILFFFKENFLSGHHLFFYDL